jgi:hypothetical protein
MNALTGFLEVVGFFAVGGIILEGLKPVAHRIKGPEKHDLSSQSSTKNGGRSNHSKKHTRKRHRKIC